MDSCLTQKIPISLPTWKPYSQLPSISGYTITSLTPILKDFLGTMPTSEGQIQADEYFAQVAEFDGKGPCIVTTVGGGKKPKKYKAFCKVTHLLDPIRTMQGYYTHPVKGERRRSAKLNNPMNQAYVDALANYLLGQLRERGLSPHFGRFFGGFQGVGKTYRFNITDEFDSYRRYRGFWENRRKGFFKLFIELDEGDDVSEESENEENEAEENEAPDEASDLIKQLQKTPTSWLHSEAFSYTTPRSSSSSTSASHTEASHESLDNTFNTDEKQVQESEELEEVTLSVAESESIPDLVSEEDEAQDNEEEESESEGYDASVFAEFENMPVMLIFQEKMDGVLDDLLEEESREDCWEERWAAWTFQVIAALCAAQAVLGFTHNDLHTNNIVYTETDQPWLFYKMRDGTTFRVPTYGKIFRLIDFGRAVFRVGETWFVSDDYSRGGDADGQYNFGPISKPMKKGKIQELVYPNPSFDLCRYSVSILEALYPEIPTERLDGLVLSEEGDWVIHETESPLWNLLWSWLIDKDGRNVLFNEDGTERFPDFDLYIHISAKVFGAKPQDQLKRAIFDTFRIGEKEIGEWEKIYPLFC